MPRERPDRPSSTHNKAERAAFSGMLTTRQLNLTKAPGQPTGDAMISGRKRLAEVAMAALVAPSPGASGA